MKLFKRTDTFNYQQQRICVTCASSFTGKYCGVCGEKVLEPGEKSFVDFLAGVVNAFTFLDGKFAKSFRLMLVRPGGFSKAFSYGIRQPYMKPVSLFFVANFIFFLFPFATSNTFSTPLKYQPNMQLYGKSAEELISAKVVADNISFDELAVLYQQQSNSLAKLLMVVMVVLFAIPLMILNYRKHLYLADHLYLSFEFNAFFIFVNMILLSTLVGILFLLPIKSAFINDVFFSRVFALTTFYFLLRAQSEFYAQRWWVAITKSIVLTFSLQYVFSAYKGILFYITMWTI
ncbi:MAG: DUF3667 domain-containing protein [Cytophagales bacterium]|jgi:hypothetical protein|nr:DUF3667 domain-containing protein [Cytophagales bacterium]